MALRIFWMVSSVSIMAMRRRGVFAARADGVDLECLFEELAPRNVV